MKMGLRGRWEQSERQFPQRTLGLIQLLGTPEGEEERRPEINGANIDSTLLLTI